MCFHVIHVETHLSATITRLICFSKGSTVGKWFQQAQEIDRLRAERDRLQAELKRQTLRLEHLAATLGPEYASLDLYGVNADERALVAAGSPIPAIKAYRERTGADLLTAKKAIDSVAV